MNAPAPAPKDGWSMLLLAGGLGLAAIAVVKLDSLLQDLGERVWALENRRPAAPPARPAGAEYAQELVPEEPAPAPNPRPAVKRTRTAPLKVADALD